MPDLHTLLMSRAVSPERQEYNKMKNDPELGEAYQHSVLIDGLPAALLTKLTNALDQINADAFSVPIAGYGPIVIPPGKGETIPHELNHINNSIKGYAQEPQDTYNLGGHANAGLAPFEGHTADPFPAYDASILQNIQDKASPDTNWPYIYSLMKRDTEHK